MTNEPNTRLATWLRERRRRNGPNVRAVYTHRNVVDLAGWRWAKAAQQAEIAHDRYKLSKANLAAAEEDFLACLREEIDLIAAAVLEDLGEKKLAAKRRKKSRKSPTTKN